MRNRPSIVPALFAFSLVLFATVLRADDRREESKRHFDEGQVQYNLGRFDKALEEFTKAYEIMPLPGFLFNMGQCQRELGNCDKAVFFFEGYLRESPSAKNRQLVVELIAECKGKIQAEQEEKRRAEEAARKRKEQVAREIERKRQEDALLAEQKKEEARLAAASKLKPLPTEAFLVEAIPSDQVEKTKPIYEEIWFWAIVSGAVAALVGGTIYTVSQEHGGDGPSGSLGTVDAR